MERSLIPSVLEYMPNVQVGALLEGRQSSASCLVTVMALSLEEHSVETL